MKLGYTIVYVPDVKSTLDFYQRAFGLQTRFLHDSLTYGELETGATTLSFAAEEMHDFNGTSARPNRPDDLAPGFEIALVTDDVAAAYQTARDAGAISVTAPTQKPWGQTVAYVRDLNGILVELCTPVSPT